MKKLFLSCLLLAIMTVNAREGNTGALMQSVGAPRRDANELLPTNIDAQGLTSSVKEEAQEMPPVTMDVTSKTQEPESSTENDQKEETSPLTVDVTSKAQEMAPVTIDVTGKTREPESTSMIDVSSAEEKKTEPALTMIDLSSAEEKKAEPKSIMIDVSAAEEKKAKPEFHMTAAEEKAAKEAKEALKGPAKSVTAVEKAEAGIISTKSNKEETSMPLPPQEIAIKKEALEKEKLPLELTPPACLPSELDTTGVDAGGNWVIKRAFWEQAEKVYEKIMKANNELYDRQVKFVKSRNEIDKISDASFRDLGFEQGKLAELLENLIEEVKEQREQQGEIDEKEREFLQTLKQKESDLNQLKLNLNAVGELEDSLNSVMSNLNQQVSVCRKYEKQAWDHFKAIGKELNDKKARLLFYEMEGFLKTVEKNLDYVSNDLWNYFNDSSEQVSEHIKKIKDEVDQLQQKGTDFAKEFDRFEKADREKDEKELEAEKEQVQKERAIIEKQKKELEQGVWGKIKSWSHRTLNVFRPGFSMAYQASVDWLSTMFDSIKNIFGMKK